MPPRHTYWTILFDGKPTAFRSATQEELLPTFKQIQGKHPDAVMMWFARGKLWRSEEEARAVFDRPRFDRPGPRPSAFARKPAGPGYGETPPKPGGRGGESENRGQKPPWRDRPQGDRPRGPKPEWRDKPRFDRPPGPPKPAWENRGPKPPWRDKPQGDRPPGPKPQWRDKPRDDRPRDPKTPRPEWRDRPQGDRPRGPKPEWKDKPRFDRPPGGKPAWNRGPKPPWRDKPRDDRPRGPNAPRPQWRDKPREDRPPGAPPAGSKSRSDEGSPKPRSGEGGRGRDWRPGGAHKDPRDRFKVPRDVKRAQFKRNLQRDRTRPPRKKKDEE